jgi:hypothetical protein
MEYKGTNVGSTGVPLWGGPTRGHKFFDKDGAIDAPPENFQGAFYYGNMGSRFFSPDGSLPQGYQDPTAYKPEFYSAWGDQAAKMNGTYQEPAATQPAATPAAGTQPATTQPMAMQAAPQPAQTGAAMPTAINANALMNAPRSSNERKPVVPLQGYQNALLRGF